MPDLTFITCRAHVLDGVEYMVSVYRGESGFTGFWGCEKCHDEGGIEKRAASREEALSRCQQAIEHHHAAHHRPAAEALRDYAV